MNIVTIPGFSEPFSSLSHLVGALVALVLGIRWIYQKRSVANQMRAVAVYVATLVLLLAISGAYHLLEPGGEPREILRRLDYAAIWLLIAGTFTPTHAAVLKGRWRWPFLALVWGLALSGVLAKTLFFHELPESAIVGGYLAFGWLGYLTGRQLRKVGRATATNWLIGGGVLYSVGALVDQLRIGSLIPGVLESHELFHLLVLAGALCHWRFNAMLLCAPHVHDKPFSSNHEALARPSAHWSILPSSVSRAP